LVFPAGNKSVAVDVRITEGRLLIAVPDSEDNKDEIEDHCAQSNVSVEALKFRKNCSLALLIEDRRKVSYLDIELGLIESIELTEMESFNQILLVKTKDYRTVALHFTLDEERREISKILNELVFPGELNDDSFLLNYEYKACGYFRKEFASPAKIQQVTGDHDSAPQSQMNKEFISHLLKNTSLKENGWNVYSFDEEFKRQGVFYPDSPFRVAVIWSDDEQDTSEHISGLI
jgi:hypothetical protein